MLKVGSSMNQLVGFDPKVSGRSGETADSASEGLCVESV